MTATLTEVTLQDILLDALSEAIGAVNERLAACRNPRDCRLCARDRDQRERFTGAEALLREASGNPAALASVVAALSGGEGGQP